ncbi:hypothetical protein GCM10022223_48780 [Kineosporia mesophila]|uniref:Uncharacterized protein n=1 Tax=Kineosporia mesophila TaxID=566012 RepID=A0ABP7A6P9_9ACTN
MTADQHSHVRGALVRFFAQPVPVRFLSVAEPVPLPSRTHREIRRSIRHRIRNRFETFPGPGAGPSTYSGQLP